MKDTIEFRATGLYLNGMATDQHPSVIASAIKVKLGMMGR
jgi:hypothetical protein